VYCAIINSSLVGMTQTDTLLSMEEMRGRRKRSRARPSFTPSHVILAHSAARTRAEVLANPRSENKGVQPAEHAAIGSGVFCHRVDECSIAAPHAVLC